MTPLLYQIFLQPLNSPPNRILTVDEPCTKSFEGLGGETVMQAGDGGITTLTINPKDSENKTKIRHGFRVKRDKEFLDFANGAKFSFEQFSDLIYEHQQLENFVLSLPALDKNQNLFQKCLLTW